MFGYVTPNVEALPEERRRRFRAVYCGLCRTLRQRFGPLGTATLSYDMTFLALLLNALYEPEEHAGRERCVTRPAKPHDYVQSECMDYVADMNLALAYHKCMDDWIDDHSRLARGEAKLLRKGYEGVLERHPVRCAAIEAWLEAVHAVEASSVIPSVDVPVNATGAMLGSLFAWRDDIWAETLRSIGDGLGRFIYFMDAYEDLPSDEKHGRFNPLRPLRVQENYEEMCRDAMMSMLADATDAFERLPIVLDADILRNVLYSGVWSRYGAIQKQRNADHKGEN